MPGFFVTNPDYRLPHPHVDIRIILIAHRALAEAFRLLRTQPPAGFVLATAKEDDITLTIYQILQDRLLRSKEVAGFDRRRFERVVRAPEIANYDYTHPAKRPDLVLFLMKREHLQVQSSHDAIFAECKPVDDAHSVGQHYCDLGIRKFVNGDYAWAMQEGMMIGYVRGGRRIDTHLAPVLASASRQATLGSPTIPALASPISDGVEPLQVTIHQRSFVWHSSNSNACEIRIFHSWHHCP
jgi:hypothetical protein